MEVVLPTWRVYKEVLSNATSHSILVLNASASPPYRASKTLPKAQLPEKTQSRLWSLSHRKTLSPVTEPEKTQSQLWSLSYRKSTFPVISFPHHDFVIFQAQVSSRTKPLIKEEWTSVYFPGISRTKPLLRELWTSVYFPGKYRQRPETTYSGRV